MFDLWQSLRPKNVDRAQGPCGAELVHLYAQNMPARRPVPTNFQGALFAIGHYFRHSLQCSRKAGRDLQLFGSAAVDGPRLLYQCAVEEVTLGEAGRGGSPKQSQARRL